MKIGYIIGSLSEQSLNRGLSKVLVEEAPEDVELSEIPIKDLPLYNRDSDANYPQIALDLKAEIEGADGIILRDARTQPYLLRFSTQRPQVGLAALRPALPCR